MTMYEGVAKVGHPETCYCRGTGRVVRSDGMWIPCYLEEYEALKESQDRRGLTGEQKP